jgi:peptide deformylase
MPKQLTILTHPHPTLRKIAEPIKPEILNDPKFRELLADMEETVIHKDGAGLAAPQIGQLVRIVLARHEDKTIFLINPQITKKSWAKEIEEEGCLSIVDNQGEIIYAPVERHKKINCIYINEKGEKKSLKAEKMLARILQHEIDHLDGILFIDKLAKPPKKKSLLKNKAN